ncbi:MAG: glycosyltransferase [Actinobacteria bacterium]|nr:glycosyltransferase [Actinomycetota bacterium]
MMAGGGELFEEIRRSAPKSLILVGFQDKNEMWSIADIGLCTSDSEGMPLSLIEAQMAGVPVVSTDVGSVSEIVEAGVTGYLAHRDSQALIDGVKRLSGNSFKTMGNAAGARARLLFSAEVMVEAHIDLYKKVLGKVAR